MADVFVSYKAEDGRRIRPLVEALEADGFSVWWDAQLGAGQEWRDEIAAELDRAKCVVVAWSKRSVGPAGRFVRDEASRALSRGVYLPVKLDKVDPPLGFGESQALSLVRWKGDRSAAAYRALLAAVGARVRGDPRERVVHQAPVRSRRAVLVGGAAGAAALAGGGGWFWMSRDRLSPEAQRLVEEARDGVNEGNVEENGNAIGKLRQAAELEPESARVWGLLAFAYVQQSRVAPASDRHDFLVRGRAAARRAAMLREEQPEALAANILAMPLYRNWLAVDRACRAALEKHPGNPYLLMCLAPLLFQVGRCEEALGALDQLLKTVASPRYRVFRTTLLWDLGRLDEAEAELDRAFSLWPRDYRVWFTRFYYLLYNGKPQEALGLINDTASRPVGIPSWNFDLNQAQAEALTSGSEVKLKASLQALTEAARKGVGFAENAAIFAAFLNDLDTAFKILIGLYLNRGFEVADVRFSPEQAIYLARERNTYILFRRQLHPVRRDPRFRDLTQEIGLRDYWKRTGTLGRVLI